MLTHLQEQYEQPVDVEYAGSLTPGNGRPRLDFHLLQCRPQNQWAVESREIQSLPTDLAAQDKFLLCTRMVPQGRVSQIEYIIYVDSDAYYKLYSLEDHAEVARYISDLNSALEGHPFILVGPGRWGSSDSMQGVPVTYADIFDTAPWWRWLRKAASAQSLRMGLTFSRIWWNHRSIPWPSIRRKPGII